MIYFLKYTHYTICFLAVLLSMIVTEVNKSFAQDTSPFVVHNIHVDVTADSAKEARDQAFREAQEKSLPTLISQLEAGGYDVSLMRKANAKSLANAVKDFEISNEKISAVRYKGDFVFRYDESLLSHYFYEGYGQAGINTQNPSPTQHPYQQVVHQTGQTEGQDRVLVLPFFQSGGGETALWEGYNPWKTLWMRSATGSIIAPIGDLSDLQDIQGDKALTYNPEKLARMSMRYGADRVLVLIASHDNATLPSSLSQPSTGLLRVSVYDTARGRPEFINAINLEERNYKNFGEALRAGYNRSVEMIHALGPVKSIGASTQQTAQQNGAHVRERFSEDIENGVGLSSIQARIEYTSMAEWLKAQSALKSIPSIATVNVLSLTPRQAELKINYKGSLDSVATAITRKGYNIQETSKAGRYLIYAGHQTRRQSAYNHNGGIVYQ